MSGVKSDSSKDEKKPLTQLIVSKPYSKIDDDPNSLGSVIRWEKIIKNKRKLWKMFFL